MRIGWKQISGKAYSLPSPSHPTHSLFPASQLAPPASLHPTWSWETERLRQFDRTTPHLRASFLRTAPSTPLPAPSVIASWPAVLPARAEAKTDKEKEDIAKALEHFSLVICEVDRVDWIDLSPGFRELWLKGDKGVWTSERIGA